MRTHRLKTWPEPFAAVVDGRKRYEVRHDDRGFAVGDLLVLEEWEPSPTAHHIPLGYTGRKTSARVAYMTPGGLFGLPVGMCVMSLEPIGASVLTASETVAEPKR